MLSNINNRLFNRVYLSSKKVKPLLTVSRGLAVPVNPFTSIDSYLGTAVPPPPTVYDNTSNHSNISSFKASDTDVLNRIINRSASKSDVVVTKADIERVRGNATGLPRRGATIPDESDVMNDSLIKAERNWELDSNALSSITNHVNPEQPHSAVSTMSNLSGMEKWIVDTTYKLFERDGNYGSIIQRLSEVLESKINAQLSVELPYEPNPKSERRVNLTSAVSSQAELDKATDDGVLLICYVDFTVPGNERVSFCSGFSVQGGSSLSPDESSKKGELVISCAHTLLDALPKSNETHEHKGLAFALTRTGHIYPIHTLLSYLPSADLILLQLQEKAFCIHEESGQLNLAEHRVRTLPVSPYPAVVDTELSVSSFGGWVPPEEEYQQTSSHYLNNANVARNRWARATLVGYRDPIGRQAETGTYDDLSQLDFTLNLESPATPGSLRSDVVQSSGIFPLPGSSGGPVVDIESGSVVGIVRGQRSSKLGDSRGDAVPSEKVFEFFALPGFGKRR